MANVPMRVRLDPQTDAALREVAESRQMPRATLARDLIRAGLAGDVLPAPDKHPVVELTLELFEAEADGDYHFARKTAALALAEIVAAGGAPAVRAIDEWLKLMWGLVE